MRPDDTPFDTSNQHLQAVADQIAKVIVGKHEVIRLLLTALLAGGHCLIEDVPGVGKTMLVRAAARSLGCDFKRVQFTPDLLPSDLTGISIYNQKLQEFVFREGPIFAQIVLADEINRTSPKTQAALLEALEEHHVTIDGSTYPLPSPFFVLATENPIDFEGTFPLPEAQLDRFLLKLSMGYPSLHEELDILDRQSGASPLESLEPVAGPEDIIAWRSQCRQVRVHQSVREYLVRIVQSTRSHPDLDLGASPRASLALYRAAQAYAFVHGRDYVVPDDVRYLSRFVLPHRMLVSPDARLAGMTAEQLAQDLVSRVPVPIPEGAVR